MNTFTDQEVYLINWRPGSCGAFLTSLVADIVYGPLDDKHISINGNAHDNLRRIVETNWHSSTCDQDDVYRYVKPKNKNIPLILYSHPAPNWEELFSIYPKCKNLIITISPNDNPRISGNFFFKTIAEWYNPEINDARVEYWNNLKNQYPELLNGINQPNDMPPHAGKIILDSNVAHVPVEPFNFDFKIPEPYINNIFLFPLSELIHDKFTVITKLESITGRKANPKIIEGYVKYLNKQEELVKTKMPWVTV